MYGSLISSKKGVCAAGVPCWYSQRHRRQHSCCWRTGTGHLSYRENGTRSTAEGLQGDCTSIPILASPTFVLSDTHCSCQCQTNMLWPTFLKYPVHMSGLHSSCANYNQSCSRYVLVMYCDFQSLLGKVSHLAPAMQAVDAIDWPEGFVRRDIGWRALDRTS